MFVSSGSENIDTVPERDNTEVVTNPGAEDPFQAAEDEAALGLETTEAEEVEEESEDTPAEENSEDAEDNPEDDGAPEPEPEAEAQEEDWDGDPNNLPDPLKKKAAGMDKYFNKQAREIAAMKREYEALLAEARADVAEKRSAGPAKVEAKQDAPPEPPGDDASQREWNEFYDQRARYNARQEMAPLLEQVEQMKAQSQQYEAAMRAQQISAEVASYPGYSPEVEERMTRIANADSSGRVWAQVGESRDFREMLFQRAKAELTIEAANAAASAKAEKDIKRKSSSANRAAPRVSSVSRAVSEDPYEGRTFKSAEEKMAFAERQATENFGG